MIKNLVKVLAIPVLGFILSAGVFAQEFSTDPRTPTRLVNPVITGNLTPEKGKSYYATFLAGPDDIFFDVSISPKENNGATFYWVIHRDIEAAVKDMPWCPEHLYLETAKKTKCVTTSGDRLTRQVVLKFGAYPNGDPVAIEYKITLSGNWKPIPLSKSKPATTKPTKKGQ